MTVLCRVGYIKDELSTSGAGDISSYTPPLVTLQLKSRLPSAPGNQLHLPFPSHPPLYPQLATHGPTCLSINDW